VVECEDYGVWAVGAGAKYKVREEAAHLALCVVIAAKLEDWSCIVIAQPEFAVFCSELGIAGTGSDLQPTKKSASCSVQERARSTTPADPGRTAISETVTAFGKRDKPLWISVDGGGDASSGLPQILLGGYSTMALAVSTDGYRRKGMIFKTASALEAIVPNSDKEVVFYDDPSFNKHPSVAAAVKRVLGVEECMTICIYPKAKLWAVGLGFLGTSRYAAAKVALAATILLSRDDAAAGPGEVSLKDDFEGVEALREFVEEARTCRPS